MGHSTLNLQNDNKTLEISFFRYRPQNSYILPQVLYLCTLKVSEQSDVWFLSKLTSKLRNYNVTCVTWTQYRASN